MQRILANTLLILVLCGLVACEPVNQEASTSKESKRTMAPATGQIPTDKSLSIGFYNVENLFDAVDDPKTLDDYFTPKGS
jgi:hypothetical protein